MHVSNRVFRAMLACYPAEFRYEYGLQMAQVFDQRSRDENPVSLWLEVIADVLFTASKEHYYMLLSDLRYAIRMLRKAPVFTLAAVLTLALGIGANTAIFSVVHAVMLRPLPYQEPERLVRIWETNPGLNIQFFSASVLNYLSWKEQIRSFEGIAAFGGGNLNLTGGGGEPERLSAGRISTNLLPMLGVRPMLGRVFAPEEERPGQDRVAILSERLWQRRFASDPKIVGSQIELNGANYQVVGVAPGDYRFPANAEIWIPLLIDPSRESRGNHVITVIGRLKPGVSLEQADTEMKSIAGGLAQTFPDSNKGWTTRMAKMYEWIVPEQIRTALKVLLGAVGLVLLIACANVANLLLARAIGRSREIALRSALGAGKTRLVRLLLTESTLLAVLGGIAGCLLAWWAVIALKQILPPNIPRRQDIGIDLTVLSFTLGVAVLTGLLFGIAPVIQASRRDLNDALKEGGRTSTGGNGWLRNGLVALEVGLATVLVIGASLLAQSFSKLQNVNLGFKPERLMTAQISLPPAKYRGMAANAFYDQLLEKLNGSPGVVGSAITSCVPFGAGDYTGMSIRAARDAQPTEGDQLQVAWRVVSADYFKVMEIPVVHGRTFGREDATSPTIIISRATAKRLFGDGDPTGKDVQYGDMRTRTRVVGVVGDARIDNLEQETATMYFPSPPALWGNMTVAIRTAGDPQAAAGLLRQKVKEIDPTQPLANIRTEEQWLENSTAQPRANATLLSIFAFVALALACVGIYGVLSYAVSQRRSEIGVRMALGAQGGHVVKMILTYGLSLAVAGLVLGIGGALALGKLVRTLLFGVSAYDWQTFTVVSVAVIAIAALSAAIPAWKASRVDPVVALRSE